MMIHSADPVVRSSSLAELAMIGKFNDIPGGRSSTYVVGKFTDVTTDVPSLKLSEKLAPFYAI